MKEFALITYDVSFENSVMMANSFEYYQGIIPVLGIFLIIINLLLIAPITEELVLRGIVYTHIKKASNPKVAIIISSLLFGCMHFLVGGGILAIGAILMGMILGYIFYKYDSLWICVISHIAANLPELILFKHTNISNNLFIMFKIIFIIILIASFVLMEKKKCTEK